MSIWCSKGATAPCLNMVGQSMKTFPSHQSSHPEPGGRSLVDGGGSKGKEGKRTFFLIKKKKKKEKKDPCGPFTHLWDSSTREGKCVASVVNLSLVKVTPGFWDS